MKIHCIGIGGIGLSGIARFLLDQGHEVSGSDSSSSQNLLALADEGMTIFGTHDEKNITGDIDTVIYSAAIPEDNVELRKAKQLGLSIHTYAETLGAMSSTLDTIAVSGSHGKTTTTGMLYSVFRAAGKIPSALIGSLMKDFDGSNVAIGTDKTFIVEACEYRGNFLPLHPKHILCTNVDYDHVDYFQTPDHYYRTFKSFFSKVGKGGFIVMRTEDSVKVGADYFAARVIFYDQYIDYLKELPDFQMKVFGEHNYHNAAAVYAFAKEYGIAEDAILEGLASFSGTARRMEYKGEWKGAKLFDDYGHHPVEVAATLNAMRYQFPDQNIYAVFQPHQYSRTRHFLPDFANAFEAANHVIIPNIYSARDSEAEKNATSVQDLVNAIAHSHPSVRDGGGFENTLAILENELKEGDILVVMGAGDIGKLFDRIPVV